MTRRSFDAVVVGSGPNGLAAAAVLASAGRSVQVLEAEETIGGGTRSAELTLPGYLHDVCSAIHPLAAASPIFSSIPLAEHGLELISPPASLAHPFDNGTAAVLEHSIEATAATLGEDGRAYKKLMNRLVPHTEKIVEEVLGPLRPPRHPIALARFGLYAARSMSGLAKGMFDDDKARVLLSGIAAHAMVSLRQPTTAGFGLMIGMLAHSGGWPIPKGGSQKIADALSCHLGSLGVEIETGRRVETFDELPSARAVMFDITPRQLLSIAGSRLPAGYRRRLEGYRYGPGVYKVDWALDGPIPWKAEECARAGTVHVGGTFDEIVASVDTVAAGKHPEEPFVLVGQQSLFDATRAPEGHHTGWSYCHVPNGSTVDMSERIENQIERFAPGFRDRILARSAMTPEDVERHNSNYIGGDINGGLQDWRQLFTRPVARLVPYSTPNKQIYICSSSTPPGGGVHGMCGYHAARAALRRSL